MRRLVVFLHVLLEVVIIAQAERAVGGTSLVAQAGNDFVGLLGQNFRSLLQTHLFQAAVVDAEIGDERESQQHRGQTNHGGSRTQANRFPRGCHHLRRWRFTRGQRGGQGISTGHCTGHGQRRCRTCARFHFQASQNHFFHNWIEILHYRRRPAGRAIDRRSAHEFVSGPICECALAREHFIQHQPQRINIAARAHFLAGKLLGRHVGWSSAADFVATNVVGHAGQAKICDDHLSASIEHDVGGFQIAVQNAFAVGRGQAGAELARDVERFVAGQASDAPQQRRQIFTVDIFHGEEGVAVDVSHVIDAANVGMRNPARDSHFIAKALLQAFVARGFVGKKLQGHGLSQGEIVSAVDFTHAAFAQQGDNPVAAGQQAARQKTALVQKIFGRTRRPGSSRRSSRRRRPPRSRSCHVDRGQIRRNHLRRSHVRPGHVDGRCLVAAGRGRSAGRTEPSRLR